MKPASRKILMPRSMLKPASAATPSGGIDLGALNELIGFRLRRIQNYLASAYAARVSPDGIKSGVMTALSIIAVNPGISQIELAREAGFDKASVVNLIDDLERLGWAFRQRQPTDRRRHALFLTPAGETAVNDLVAVAKEVETSLIGHIAPSQRALLAEVLDEIFQRCVADDAL